MLRIFWLCRDFLKIPDYLNSLQHTCWTLISKLGAKRKKNRSRIIVVLLKKADLFDSNPEMWRKKNTRKVVVLPERADFQPRVWRREVVPFLSIGSILGADLNDVPLTRNLCDEPINRDRAKQMPIFENNLSSRAVRSHCKWPKLKGFGSVFMNSNV
jgi:hypothetical protein